MGISEDLNNYIHVLSQINRFTGHTYWPYSVLEHTIHGLEAMRVHEQSRNEQRAWFLHDFHEVKFGDIIRPVRKQYMTPDFDLACNDWDNDLTNRMGFPNLDLQSTVVRAYDDAMLAAELEIVSTLNDPSHPYDPFDPIHRACGGVISSRSPIDPTGVEITDIARTHIKELFDYDLS